MLFGVESRYLRTVGMTIFRGWFDMNYEVKKYTLFSCMTGLEDILSSFKVCSKEQTFLQYI